MNVDAAVEALGAPFAAIDLAGPRAPRTFADLPALCAWVLEQKGGRKLAVEPGHLVWDGGDEDQRATVVVKLRDQADGPVAARLHVVAADADAATFLAALKAARTAHRVAA